MNERADARPAGARAAAGGRCTMPDAHQLAVAEGVAEREEGGRRRTARRRCRRRRGTDSRPRARRPARASPPQIEARQTAAERAARVVEAVEKPPQATFCRDRPSGSPGRRRRRCFSHSAAICVADLLEARPSSRRRARARVMPFLASVSSPSFSRALDISQPRFSAAAAALTSASCCVLRQAREARARSPPPRSSGGRRWSCSSS